MAHQICSACSMRFDAGDTHCPGCGAIRAPGPGKASSEDCRDCGLSGALIDHDAETCPACGAPLLKVDPPLDPEERPAETGPTGPPGA